MFHARLHSAGHLLDSALLNMGMTDLIPAKVLRLAAGSCHKCGVECSLVLVLPLQSQRTKFQYTDQSTDKGGGGEGS